MTSRQPHQPQVHYQKITIKGVPFEEFLGRVGRDPPNNIASLLRVIFAAFPNQGALASALRQHNEALLAAATKRCPKRPQPRYGALIKGACVILARDFGMRNADLGLRSGTVGDWAKEGHEVRTRNFTFSAPPAEFLSPEDLPIEPTADIPSSPPAEAGVIERVPVFTHSVKRVDNGKAETAASHKAPERVEPKPGSGDYIALLKDLIGVAERHGLKQSQVEKLVHSLGSDA